MSKKTGFEKLKQLLRDKPKDRAIRVDRTVLEDCLIELTAVVMRVQRLERKRPNCSVCLDRGSVSGTSYTEVPCTCPAGTVFRQDRK